MNDISYLKKTALIAGLMICFMAGHANAQSTAAAPSKLPSVEAGVQWEKLTPLQQQALKPIQPDWASLDATRKKKWLAVAQRYAALPAADQVQMHSRMQAWSQLSPAQRQTARDNYTQALSSPSSSPVDGSNKANLNEQWTKYQALPPERRAAIQAAAEKSKTAPANGAVKTKPLSPAQQ